MDAPEDPLPDQAEQEHDPPAAEDAKEARVPPGLLLSVLLWPVDHPFGALVLMLLHFGGVWAIFELDTYGHFPLPPAVASWSWTLLSISAVCRYWPA